MSAHTSSKKRNYLEFYKEIFSGVKSVKSIVDLGCGANGFSYDYLKKELGNIDYVGIEAAGQLVEHMNKYFEMNNFKGEAVCMDLFDIKSVLEILKKQERNRVVFLFQVIDALENLERDFSKKFILEISKECELMVISLPTESSGGRKRFEVQRKWLVNFLEDNFVIKKDFEVNGERILVIDIGDNKVP